MNLSDYSIPASAVLARLASLGVDHLITVPDWVQMALHERLGEGAAGIRQINACSENQCVTLAAGLTLEAARLDEFARAFEAQVLRFCPDGTLADRIGGIPSPLQEVVLTSTRMLRGALGSSLSQRGTDRIRC